MRLIRPAVPLLVAAGLTITACGSTQAPAPKHHRTPVISSAAAKSRARQLHIVPGAAPRIPTAKGLCPGDTTICVSTSPRLRVAGPGSTRDKLLRQLSLSNPTLTPVKLACPRATTAYPFNCTVDGHVGTGAAQVDVSGSLQVLGIETVTDLYAYELNYEPIRD